MSPAAARTPDVRDDTSTRADSNDDLAWVANILWGIPLATTIGPPARQGNADALDTFVALPSAKHPHLLLPSSRVVAGRALQHYTDARRSIRAATAILGTGIRAGIPPVIGDKVRVARPADDSSPAEPRRPSLKEYLAEVLERPDIEIAVRMGRHRPNRKPVLQVLSASGDVLAYAKVGWNSLTRSLIRNEAKVLTAFADGPQPQTFAVPRLIHAGQCGDLDVLVLAAVSPLPVLGRAFFRNEVLIAGREIASLESNTREELAASGWWRDMRARLERLRGSVRQSRFEVLHDLTGLIEERYGEIQVMFGGWHGDWTCWNMGRRDYKLVVLDWERSGPRVPIGVDAAHFDFNMAVKLRRKPPLEAVARLLDGDGYLLPSWTRDVERVRLLISLDLLEMVLRFEEAHVAGLDVVDTTYFGALRSAVLSGVGASRGAR
jgi:hypothetical protein